LDSLGALTRGQRQTGGNGIFDTKDNLESNYAEYAWEQCDFVRSGFNSQLNGLILNKNQFFVAIAARNT
jgi:hypothetical protein